MNIFPSNNTCDDDEFILALSDSWTCESISFDELKQQEKLFTPFDLNEYHNTPLYDIDPDIQYYSNQVNASLHNCDYFLEEGFNKAVSSLNIKSKCLSLMHINIRSAVKK